MIREQWVEAFAREVGLPEPTREEVDAILTVARLSAKGSEKTTAPVACYLAGRSGRPLEELLGIARALRERQRAEEDETGT